MYKNKIILIVDDDPDDRFFFHKAVKEIDDSNTCREAQHGVEGLQLLRSVPQLPDFIFLDLNMPMMDGREFLTEVKKDDKLKNIPVIIYTTSSYQKDVELTALLGAAYFLTKPSDVFNLPVVISKAIEMAQLVQAS